MATVQSRKKPVIQKGNGTHYDPETFKQEHHVPFFFETESAQEVLDAIKPFEVMGKRFITFDTETTWYYKSSHDVPPNVVRRWVGTGSKASPQDFPFCISICDGKVAYTLYDTLENDFKEFKKLAPLLGDPSIGKVAHNIKFDRHMLQNAGVPFAGEWHDTVIVAKLVNENRPSYRLRDLAKWKHRNIIKFEDMVDTYKQLNKITDYRMIPRELLSEYANADVWNAFLVFEDEYPKLAEQELMDLYMNECALSVVLYEMERNGMKVDLSYEEPLVSELRELCDTSEQAIYDEAGGMFNINSGKQLYDVLMRLGVDPLLIGRTDKGNPKLDKNVLADLAEHHGVSLVQKILEFRKNDKLLNTYAVGIYSQHDSEARVHGGINGNEAVTGRMSITKPALQTLPKKDTRIRKMFIPEEGYELYFMDLDQVEYRLFAHYAQASSLIEAIKNGHDVHAATAATIYRKTIDEVLPDERQRAKTINFSLIYGQGDEASARAFGTSVAEAREIKANYFAHIPEARPFIRTVHAVVEQRGYVRNFFGRRRRLKVDEAYKAPNALIQGCAADYIKHKLVDMYKYIKYYNLDIKLINVVHDEVVIECHESAKEHLPMLRWLLSDFSMFRVPITAGAEKGSPSWGEKVEEAEMPFTEPPSGSFRTFDVFS